MSKPEWELHYTYRQSYWGSWIVFNVETGEIISEWMSPEQAYEDAIESNRKEVSA